MSRTGTCKHAVQTMTKWIMPRQPHEREVRVDLPDGDYSCRWAAQFGEMPPSVARWPFPEIRDGDCERCSRYEVSVDLAKMLGAAA